MRKIEFAAVASDPVGQVRIVGTRQVRTQSSAVVPGKTWLRNLETQEAVLVTETGPFMTRYINANCDGEVKTENLLDHFAILRKMPADAEPA